MKIEMNAVRHEGVGRWGGKKGYRPLILPLAYEGSAGVWMLWRWRLALVFPCIAVGTQGFVECGCCVGGGWLLPFQVSPLGHKVL